MAFLNFNARNVQPQSSSFELLPRGKYMAICVDSEIKTNQARTGEYLKLTFEIIEGPYKGRKVFDQINIRHQNAKAVEIAHGILSSLCHAVGVLELQDSAQLHQLPLYLGIGIEKGTNGYEDKNRIYSYHSLKEEPAPPQTLPTSSYAPPPAAAPRPPAASAWGAPPPRASFGGNPIADDDIPF